MQDLEIGQKSAFTRTISESDVNLFAELTGDFNPIHVDSEYAGRTRYGKKGPTDFLWRLTSSPA